QVISRDRDTSRRKAKSLARRLGASASIVSNAPLDADLIWLCVPDGEIAKCARSLAAKDWNGKIAIHSSGALTSDDLQVLRTRGAHVASAHPMMTFVDNAKPALQGVGFAIEGDREAVQVVKKIVHRIGGES